MLECASKGRKKLFLFFNLLIKGLCCVYTRIRTGSPGSCLSMLLIFEVTLANHQKKSLSNVKTFRSEIDCIPGSHPRLEVKQNLPPQSCFAASTMYASSTMILQPIYCLESTMCACSTMILQPTPPHPHTPTPPIS